MEEETIENCLAHLVEQDMTLKRVVNDLQGGGNSKYPLTPALLANLEAEARVCVRAMRTRLEELTLAAGEEESAIRQAEYRQAIDNYQSQLAGSQTVFRQAVLAAHRRLEQADKARLLEKGSGAEGDDQEGSRQRKNRNTEAMASRVSENMMGLSRLLHSQLAKSEDTMSHLVQSSSTVKETHEEFKVMGGHINTTTRLLNKFGRRETTDRILMFLAFLFFFITCSYIFVKRVF